MATPDLYSAKVQAFCRDHFPDGSARYLLVQATPGSLPSECFPNVERMVRKKGGRMVLGWHLWEIPGLLLEAEYHAVWEKPSGVIVDVTPQLSEFKEDRILFVPRRKDRLGKNPPDNLRCPLSDDPDIVHMCQLKEQYVRVMGTARPEGTPGHFSLPTGIIEPIMAEHQAVMARLIEKYPDRMKGMAPGLSGPAELHEHKGAAMVPGPSI